MAKSPGPNTPRDRNQAEDQKHQSILEYKKFHYLKWAIWAVVVASIGYAVSTVNGGVPDGGTPIGYALGVIGALLIAWLMWFGIRKRRYGGTGAPVEDWLSAHVYLGIALIAVATLHTGFQFGWNVHTVAYALMMIVIFTGVIGLFVYMRVPELMTQNRRGMTLEQMMREISSLDAECRTAALPLGDEVNQLVLESAERTRIGGGIRNMLLGGDPACPTEKASKQVQYLASHTSTDQDEGFRALLALLARKLDLLARARKDVRYKSLLDIWLYFHVPLSFALIGALVAHVVSVFIYW